ncbi:MAG TPA: hypothetical protein VEB66_13110 [Opitutaceae bacterium]|nr:hypothetical protein [Opitutaceae bacterium]
MRARPLTLLLLIPLAALGQDRLAGRVEGGLYHSATGAFRIAIPVAPELGGRILDTANVVTFEDDFDTHLSIACFALDLTQKWELESRGRNAYLNYFFTTFVMPDFERRYPGSTLAGTRFLPEVGDGALAVFCLLPGGSYFDGRHELDPANPTRPPATAKRGNLLFVRNGHVFVLSAELAERVLLPSSFRKTPEEEDELLARRLRTYVGRMSFPAPGAPRG